MFSFINRLLLRFKPSYFKISLFFWLSLPILVFTPLFILLIFHYGTMGMEDDVYSIPFVLAAIFFGLWEIIYLFQCSFLRKERKDRRKGAYLEIEGYLVFSERVIGHRYFNLPNKITGIYYYTQGAAFHKCCFRPKDNEISHNHFYFILTKKRLDIFRKLFLAEEKYGRVGLHPHRIDFSREIPVKIILGKSSSVLKRICPVDSYAYTNEQQNLIQRLNENSKKTMEEKCSCLPYRWGVLLCESIFLGFLLFDMSLYVHGLFADGGGILNSLAIYFLNPALFFVYGFVLAFAYQCLTNPEECTDVLRSWVGKETESEDVMLISSDSFRSSFNGTWISSYLFPEESPLFQKLSYRPFYFDREPEYHTEKYINWICTRSKINVLDNLYECKEIVRFVPLPGESTLSTEPYRNESPYRPWASRSDEPALRKGLSLRDGVPLNITYKSSGSELISIAPVKGYHYTPEQLAAIERFNTLYP